MKHDYHYVTKNGEFIYNPNCSCVSAFHWIKRVRPNQFWGKNTPLQCVLQNIENIKLWIQWTLMGDFCFCSRDLEFINNIIRFIDYWIFVNVHTILSNRRIIWLSKSIWVYCISPMMGMWFLFWNPLLLK